MKNKSTKIILAVLSVLMVLTVLTSCDMGLPGDIELWGVWDDGYGTVKTFTNKTFDFDAAPSDWGEYDYSGEVVSYDNSSYNIASENPAEGNFGHMILKITAHKATPSSVDTYTVIRWKNFTTTDGVTTVDLSEAYPAGWTSVEAAQKATEADNFAMYSTHTLTKE